MKSRPLGISQLKIKVFHRKRVKWLALSKNFKEKLPNLMLPDEKMFNNSSHHLYIIKLNDKFNISRDKLMLWLKKWNFIKCSLHANSSATVL